MTPIEIFEYKQQWKPGYSVRLHSDLRSRGKDFCKAQFLKQHWDISTFTDVYEDTFMFEHRIDADQFASQWPEYTNLETKQR